MIDNKIKQQLDEFEFVIIPTQNVIDMYQDDLGLIKGTFGCNTKDGNILIFANHDTFHKLGD